MRRLIAVFAGVGLAIASTHPLSAGVASAPATNKQSKRRIADAATANYACAGLSFNCKRISQELRNHRWFDPMLPPSHSARLRASMAPLQEGCPVQRLASMARRREVRSPLLRAAMATRRKTRHARLRTAVTSVEADPLQYQAPIKVHLDHQAAPVRSAVGRVRVMPSQFRTRIRAAPVPATIVLTCQAMTSDLQAWGLARDKTLSNF